MKFALLLLAMFSAQVVFADGELIPTPLTFSSVKPFFDQCAKCHKPGTLGKKPDLTVFPFSLEPAKQARRLISIAENLALEKDGDGREMPPKRSTWQPTKEDLALVKQWIRDGARDDHGQATLSAEDIEKAIGPAQH